jgi:hypothetical protein
MRLHSIAYSLVILAQAFPLFSSCRRFLLLHNSLSVRIQLVGDELVAALDIEITIGKAAIYVHDSLGSHVCLPDSTRAACTYHDDMGYDGHLRVLEGDWLLGCGSTACCCGPSCGPSCVFGLVNGMSLVLHIAPNGTKTSIRGPAEGEAEEGGRQSRSALSSGVNSSISVILVPAVENVPSAAAAAAGEIPRSVPTSGAR